LFKYRRGELANTVREKFFTDNPPRLATLWLVQAMATWREKDYWGAIVTWTKAYGLIQAGARQGLVKLPVKAEIFPGTSEPDYLEGAWYDWAVTDLLLREWDEMIGEAEQSVTQMHTRPPTLEELAILRGAGECHALRGEWVQALACAQHCRQFNQQDSLDHATMDYVNAGIACLQLGEEKTYLQVREEMATRFKNAYEVAPWRTLEVGLLRPLDDRVADIFTNLAAGIAGWSQNETNDYWGQILLSLHAYRQANYTQAMDLARQSLTRVRDGGQLPLAEVSIISALTLNRLGNHSAAVSELEEAESVIRTSFNLEYDVWHWRHWVGVRLLLQEARGLISQTPAPQPGAAPR
jgi:tetratricopeptide (TPR) repeat protein